MDVQSWVDDREALRFDAWSERAVRSRRLAPAVVRRPLLTDVGNVSALERASIEEIRRHARRLAAFSAALGRHIQLSDSDLHLLRLGSLLHDVGKTAIPAQVLFKCGRLTDEEFSAIKFHPIIGDLLCARAPGLAGVRPMVRYHHERLDGSGYPDGLVGDAIPFLAQIVGVVDVYDALVYSRPYKPAFDSDHAFSILKREADIGWRRGDLVDALIDVVEGGQAECVSTAAAV